MAQASSTSDVSPENSGLSRLLAEVEGYSDTQLLRDQGRDTVLMHLYDILSPRLTVKPCTCQCSYLFCGIKGRGEEYLLPRPFLSCTYILDSAGSTYSQGSPARYLPAISRTFRAYWNA